MRKLIAILVVALTVTACQPRLAGLMSSRKVTSPRPARVDQAKAFLQLALAIHNDPFLVCTRGHESDTAGGYAAYNPAGPAYGAYQFLQPTWDSTARHYGWNWLVGVSITTVPGFIQDLMGAGLYRWQGKAPWSYLC